MLENHPTKLLRGFLDVFPDAPCNLSRAGKILVALSEVAVCCRHKWRRGKQKSSEIQKALSFLGGQDVMQPWVAFQISAG